jgi:hypothetical protein
VHIRRMVLRLRPEQRFLRHERHLIRVACLCRNAKSMLPTMRVQSYLPKKSAATRFFNSSSRIVDG